MKVSGLIPCHNYAHMVGEAIDSALAQDYAGEVEIIVIDDGSTDGSPEVLARHEGRIIALRQANGGMCAALNSGYRRATGDVIELPRRRRRLAPWQARHTSAVSVHRKIASLLFPLPARLRGNADDLITGAAALLAPVAFLPEALSLYRIHGDNLFAARFLAEYDRAHHGASPGEPAPAAAPSAPFEDVDLYDEKQRRIRLSEEQARFGNEVLQRAGLPGALSPWSSPLYRTFRLSLVKSQRFTFLLPVLRAYGSMRPVPIWKRVLQGTKALKAVLRGAP